MGVAETVLSHIFSYPKKTIKTVVSVPKNFAGLLIRVSTGKSPGDLH
jgi:hypothetical protein